MSDFDAVNGVSVLSMEKYFLAIRTLCGCTLSWLSDQLNMDLWDLQGYDLRKKTMTWPMYCAFRWLFATMCPNTEASWVCSFLLNEDVPFEYKDEIVGKYYETILNADDNIADEEEEYFEFICPIAKELNKEVDQIADKINVFISDL